MRCASSIGTVFGYPEPVNPLMPIWSPDRIKAAASAALIIFRSKLGFKTRVPVGDAILMEKPSLSEKRSTLTVAATVSPVCDFNHSRVWRLNMRAEKDLSLISQRRHGIHFGCTTCRNVASQQRHKDEYEHDSAKRNGISRTQSKQERAQSAGQDDRSTNSDRHTDQRGHESLPQHQAKDIPRSRSQGDPRAQFSCASRYRIGHHAIETCNCQQ